MKLHLVDLFEQTCPTRLTFKMWQRILLAVATPSSRKLNPFSLCNTWHSSGKHNEILQCTQTSAMFQQLLFCLELGHELR
jgi:hypothetical protein